MFWKDLNFGFKTYGKAFELIFSKGLWWFFIFPVIFNLLLFWGGIEGVGFFSDWIDAKVHGWIGLDEAEFWGSGVLSYILTFIIKGFFNIIFIVLFAYVGGFIVLIVMSPVLAYLSEKTEKIITGKDYPFSSTQLMKDIARGIGLALRNMFYELSWTLIAFIITIVPIIGWLFSLLQLDNIFLFIIASYFYGFSFLDYSIERQKFSIRKSVKLVRRRKGVAIANGMIFSICLFIPFIGVGMAGFTAIISTVAATIAMTEIVKQESNNPMFYPVKNENS